MSKVLSKISDDYKFLFFIFSLDKEVNIGKQNHLSFNLHLKFRVGSSLTLIKINLNWGVNIGELNHKNQRISIGSDMYFSKS